MIPVVLVALIWLGYIFWLIFHEGENIGSGSPAASSQPSWTATVRQEAGAAGTAR